MILLISVQDIKDLSVIDNNIDKKDIYNQIYSLLNRGCEICGDN